MAGRLLQGAAGALIVAVYMPIITTSVVPEQRGRAIGFVITIMTVGAMAGVPLGGLIADVWGWRAVFLVKLPVVIAVLWVGLRTITRIPNRGLPRPGAALVREALLLGGAVAVLLLAFEEVDARPLVAAALAVGAIGLATWWSRLAASRPVLGLVRTPAFGSDPHFTAGGHLHRRAGRVPPAVLRVRRAARRPGRHGRGAAVLRRRDGPALGGGRCAGRPVRQPVLAIAGSAVSLVAMLLMLTLDAAAGLVDMAWRLVVLGIGAALYNPAINASMLAAAPCRARRASAGGVGMTVRTIAMTVAPAASALTWTVAGGGIPGFRSGVVMITVAVAVGLLVLLVPVRRP